VTIHKGQGKTFDKVIVDLGGRAFAHGQTYVALSRCTTFEGLILARPLKASDVLTDYRVHKFLTGYRYCESEEACPFDEKVQMIEQCLNNGWALDITYLKPNNQKSRRTVKPLSLGEMSYQGKKFQGLNAYCLLRQEERNFRVDRILELEIIKG